MAVTTKKTFNAVGSGGQSSTTVFTPVSIELNNQDDLDVYVTKTTAGIGANNGLRIKHYRQSTSSNLDANHDQVNDTTGLYFPALTHTGGTETLQNYTISTDNNTITFNSALPSGAVVSIERRTRDSSSDYTNFAGGSTIRHTDVNKAFDESNFTAQEARNKAFDLERQIFNQSDGNLRLLEDKGIYFEGATNDAFETQLTVADPTADNTITFPDRSGTVITSGDTQTVTSTMITDGTIQRGDLAADLIDGTKIDDDAINSEHYVDRSIDTQHIGLDQITNALIADNQIDSEHYVDGSIDRVHLASDIVDGTKIEDDSIDSEHIAAGALDNEHYAAGSITSDKLNGATVITASEQGSATTNDTSFLTSAAADARFFNISTGDTIKDGDTFPDNDTTIATTAAINDRIIDLVDDVGGFVPIANETSFPNANPDVNNGAGTLISIKALSSNLTSNGSGVATITNGTVGNSTVTITGLANSTTYAANFGMIVETTTTLNTYTFHRQVPIATEVSTVAGNISNVNTVAGISSNVTTVAGIASDVTAVAADATDIGAVAAKATEIGRLGTADAVADLNTLGTADVVADLNTLGTADVVADMNTLATADVVADMNTLATTSNVNNMNTVAGSIANVNTTATNITHVNNCSSNISDVHNYADLYQVATSAPSTRADSSSLEAGDMWFDSSSNKELKVHNGTAYQLVTPSQSVLDDIAIVSGNITFTEDLGLITDALSTGTGDSIETCADNITKIQALGATAVVADMALLATTDCIADMAILGTADVVSDLNTLGTADVVADMNKLATTDCVNDMNTLGTTANVNNMSTVAGISSNVTTVAGISSNVTTAANNNANITTVAGNNANITSVAGNATNINTVAGVSGNVTTVAGIASNVTTAATNNANITTVAGSIANVNTTAGAIGNVNNVGNSISNVNTVSGSIADVNRYASEYTIASSNPGSPSEGDLWYNSTGNTLNYYNGSSWVGISPGIAALVSDTSPQLGGHLNANSKNITNGGQFDATLNGAITSATTATTQSTGDNTTKVATTAFVKAAIDALVDSAPGTLNTLNELAAALGDDSNYAATTTAALNAKAPLASPTFTGTVTAGTITGSNLQLDFGTL